MYFQSARIIPSIGFALIIMSGSRGYAAETALQTKLLAPALEIALYPGTAPGSEKWDWQEQILVLPRIGLTVVRNVVRPVLQYYPADKARAVGTAMIVAPGGAFRFLTIGYEGVDIARRLNKMGIDAFVLKYRLIYSDPNQPPTPLPKPRQAGALPANGDIAVVSEGPQAGLDLSDVGGADGRQAVRVLRERAAEFGVRSDRIGIMGFPAGGHVTLSPVMGPADTRPNFATAIYPAWWGSKTPPVGAPPLFIAVASDDDMVGPEESLGLYRAWYKAGIPAELHIFQAGKHGFFKKGGGGDHFMDRLEEWLKLNGWLTLNAN